MRTSLRSMTGLLFLAMAMTTGAELTASHDVAATQSDHERFIGAWRLASLKEPGAGGKLHRSDCTGQFVFTRDGYASVQVMYRDTGGGDAGAVQYAQGGYETSYGRYDIDERTQTWTFRVEGALVRRLVGQDLKRLYEFSGNQLIVKPASPTNIGEWCGNGTKRGELA
ncbi:MAG: lipocalin-like domain-containing protein [Acidobacteriota bacterium]